LETEAESVIVLSVVWREFRMIYPVLICHQPVNEKWITCEVSDDKINKSEL
jgi:hypothetical protein